MPKVVESVEPKEETVARLEWNRPEWRRIDAREAEVAGTSGFDGAVHNS